MEGLRQRKLWLTKQCWRIGKDGELVPIQNKDASSVICWFAGVSVSLEMALAIVCIFHLAVQ
jgi:hypothetical protein